MAAGLLAAFLGTAAAAYDYEQNSSGPVNSVADRESIAMCDPGMMAVGGGFRVNPATTLVPEFLVNSSFPLVSQGVPVGWVARVHEAPFSGSFWNMTAYAVCAPMRSVEVVTASSPISTDNIAVIEAHCAEGDVALGGGGEVAGDIMGKMLVQNRPLPLIVQDGAVPPGWRAEALEVEPSAGFYQLTAYAICGAPLPDLSAWHTLAGSSSEDTFRDFHHECGPDLEAIGGGWGISGGAIGSQRIASSQAVVTSLLGGPRDGYRTTMFSTQSTISWTAHGYTICAPEPELGASAAVALLALAILRACCPIRPGVRI